MGAYSDDPDSGSQAGPRHPDRQQDSVVGSGYGQVGRGDQDVQTQLQHTQQ